jgi:hypothetical protein
MKTITELTAANVTDDGKAATIQTQAAFVRRGETVPPPFWRRQRQTAKGIFLESSAGGQVLITNEALWAAGEQHEALLKAPVE